MSLPVCTRCQKIYAESIVPEKCVNCGGEVKGLVIKAKPAVPNPQNLNSASDFVDRECFREGCHGLATKSIKYIYSGREIVMAPSPKIQDRDAQDLCPIHANEFKAPNSWTLVHKTNLPPTLGSSQASLPTSQNNGDGSFGAVIAGIIFLAIVIFLGWQLLSWLFSLDWSNDGEPTRFRIPFRRR
jgi:hypothetical protein